MAKIADLWKLGALNTPTVGDVPYTWAQRTERSLKWLERVLRLLHLRIERATVAPDERLHYVDADFSVTNDTTLAMIPNLSFDLPYPGAFKFRARLVYDCGAGGTQYTIDGTATYSLALWYTRNQRGTSFVESTRHIVVPDAANETTSTTGTVDIEGVLVVATAGTVGVQLAQSVADAAASTVLAGSWFEIDEAANPLAT